MAWSPDGLLATPAGNSPTSDALPQHVAVLRSDGKVVARSGSLVPFGTAYWSRAEGAALAWSPDGKVLLVAIASSGIYRVSNLRSGSTGRIAGGGSFAYSPSWRPLCGRTGSSRDNRIVGGAGAELLCGRGGNDTIIGAAGRDRLFGGDGNDRLLAHDHAFDVVGCGAGRDSVLADRADLVGVDCEQVLRR